MTKKRWAVTWLLFGLYFVIVCTGKGAGVSAAISMFCGFMVARNLADTVPHQVDSLIMAVKFSDLIIGDRFRRFDALWTKVDYSSARKHGAESIALGNQGYGYRGDSICSFEQNDKVVFVSP